MPVVLFENPRKTLNVIPGTNLRTAALKSGVALYKPFFRVFHLNLDIGPVQFPCGCDIVEIEGKGTNARSEEEEKVVSGRFFTKRKVTPNLRLACQVNITGDITVRTHPKLEVDPIETKRQRGYIAVVSAFLLLMALIVAIIGLDLVQKI